MKKVLFFLIALLTLSSCQLSYDNLNCVDRGKIEKIDEGSTAYVGGIAYSFKDSPYKFYEEDFRVGDDVNVYSDGEDFFLSKVDYLSVRETLNKMNSPNFFILSFQHSFIATILLLFLGLFVAFFLPMLDEDYFGNYLFHFVIGGFVACSLVYFCFAHSLTYEGIAPVNRVDNNYALVDGTAYAKNKINDFKHLRAGLNYFIYNGFGHFYLQAQSTISQKNPDLLAKIVLSEIRAMGGCYLCLWSVIFVVTFSAFWRFLFKIGDKVKRISRKKHKKSKKMVAEVEPSGGHGAFLKE